MKGSVGEGGGLHSLVDEIFSPAQKLYPVDLVFGAAFRSVMAANAGHFTGFYWFSLADFN